MTTERRLLKIKQKINSAQSETDEARGALDQMTSQLRDEFECDDLKSARSKAKDNAKKIATYKDELDVGLQEIEDEFNLSS